VDGRLGAELRGAVSELRVERAREEQDRKRFFEGYTELAAIGQAALGLTAETHLVLSQVTSAVAELRSSISKQPGIADAMAVLENEVTALDQRLSMISAIESGTVRRRRTIDVGSELETFRELFSPLLALRGIRMHIELRPEIVLRTEINPQTFRRVLHILLSNSIDWLGGVDRPIVVLSTRSSVDRCEVLFSDNGPGIAPELAERVFEPMFSLKEGGQGMGLAIARNLVTLASGNVEAVVDRRRRGATIKIDLPRKRSRAT